MAGVSCVSRMLVAETNFLPNKISLYKDDDDGVRKMVALACLVVLGVLFSPSFGFKDDSVGLSTIGSNVFFFNFTSSGNHTLPPRVSNVNVTV